MRPLKTVIGIFTEEADAEGAIGELKRRGFDPKDISLIMRDSRRAEDIEEHTGVGEGAASGAATGAVVGGITGLLIGIGALAIPGIGAVLIGGPLAAGLGLTGAAATTATGAMTGALAGGLIGALMSLGLPREEAEHYEQQIQAGAILLAIPAMEGQEVEAEEILRQYRATDIKSMTMNTDSALYQDREDAKYASPIEVQKYLKHVDYPASKDELVQEAAEEGADRTVIHTLQDLPEERFSSPTSLSRALGHR